MLRGNPWSHPRRGKGNFSYNAPAGMLRRGRLKTSPLKTSALAAQFGQGPPVVLFNGFKPELH